MVRAINFSLCIYLTTSDVEHFFYIFIHFCKQTVHVSWGLRNLHDLFCLTILADFHVTSELKSF